MPWSASYCGTPKETYCGDIYSDKEVSKKHHDLVRRGRSFQIDCSGNPIKRMARIKEYLKHQEQYRDFIITPVESYSSLNTIEIHRIRFHSDKAGKRYEALYARDPLDCDGCITQIKYGLPVSQEPLRTMLPRVVWNPFAVSSENS